MRCLTVIYGASLVETITVRVVVRILLCLTVAAIFIVAIETTVTAEALVTAVALVTAEALVTAVSLVSRRCRSWRRYRRWYRLRVSWGLLSFYASDTTTSNRVLYSIFVSCSKASL